MDCDPSNMNIGDGGGGALSHLVEAATALANLTSVGGGAGDAYQTQPLRTPDDCSNKKHVTIISDEDENQQDQQQQQQSTSSPAAAPRPPVSKEIFPSRLMAILNDASLVEVITWLPHGRSFVIIRPDVFTERVLPKYLPPADARSSTKYPSFTRKLNRWGFRQATRGPDTGAFHHPLFQRNKPELCLEMVCQRSRDRRGNNLPAKKRPIAALTKESLDTFNGAQELQQQQETTLMTPQQQQLHSLHQALAVATVSVSGDSQSSTSTNSNNHQRSTSAALTATGVLVPSVGITTDARLTQRALLQRNEEERMRVAKAMLYHAYLEAIQR